MLRDRLLAGVPDDEAESLTFCAAGREPSEGLLLSEKVPPEPFPVGLWESGTHTTLLRLLLLRRLARRPGDWRTAHERLSKDVTDIEAQLYHSIALGKVTTVASTAADVRNALFSLKDNPVPGVSGELYFREQPLNDLWPYGRPVPVVPLGRVAGTWNIPGTYRTQ